MSLEGSSGDGGLKLVAGEIDLGIDGLNDYKEIGSGGFATVYSALEVDLDRRVAVKVLAAIDDAGRRRFDRERLTMGRTADHPNIVTPLRSGYTGVDNKPYLVMEYLSRGSLQDLLEAQGPMPWRQAFDAILPIADALGFSHSSGVVHKDVKPANILVSRTGVVKLSDFGIAAIREATSTSQVAYSILYTAPETFDAGHAANGQGVMDPRDERSDLYSLAATLYALGTGRPPFQSATAAGLIGQIISTPVPATGLEALDDFLAVAMAKDPAARHLTAAHFIAALRSIALEPVTGTSHHVAQAQATQLHPSPASDTAPRPEPRPVPRAAQPPAAFPLSSVSVRRPDDRALSPLHQVPPSSSTPDPNPGTHAPRWFARRQALTAIGVGLAIGFLLAVGYLGVGYYNRSIWFVGPLDDGTVSIFQGRPGGLLWLEPELQSTGGPSVNELIPEDRDQVAEQPSFKSEAEAQRFVESLTPAAELTKDQAAQLGGVELSSTTTTVPAGGLITVPGASGPAGGAAPAAPVSTAAGTGQTAG